MIFEGDEYEEDEEIHIKDLEQAPPKFEDTQPQVHDPIKEMNLGIVEEQRITYTSSLLPSILKERIVEILQEFKDCFAWNYDKMPRLDGILVEHRLPIKSEFHPFQQPPKRMSKEVDIKVKEEIEKLLKAKFIKPTRYVWRPHTRPNLEAEPDPGTWTSFTIYTFSNTIEINVAYHFDSRGPTVFSINTFIQYGMYALSTLSFTKHYQSSSPQINQICSSHENLNIFCFITKRI